MRRIELTFARPVRWTHQIRSDGSVWMPFKIAASIAA